MKRRSGLQHRLTRVYLLHVLLISLATAAGVVATAFIVENVLVKQALKKEADHFWTLRRENPEASRPNTRHLLGLLKGPKISDAIPDPLLPLEPGYHRVHLGDQDPIVYVEDHDQARLYLIFDEKRVTALAVVFGVLPLTGVLLVIYLTSFLAWRKSRQLVSPLVQLAEELRHTATGDPEAIKPDLSGIEAEADSEVAVLVLALEGYADRLLEFVERERQFSRDASHELRTPLAVIKANLELLARKLPDAPAIHRIEDTVEDMGSVIETLLMLARSENKALPEEDIIVNDLAMNLADRLEPLACRKGVEISVEQKSMMTLHTAEPVLAIVLTNLMRNAINYSGFGRICVQVGGNEVIVSDSGRGMEPEELERVMQPFERGSNDGESGHGLGLAIVQRLCEHSHWKLDVASEPGEGTRVRVRFPSRQVN
jgi:signal transduction histidine kinase